MVWTTQTASNFSFSLTTGRKKLMLQKLKQVRDGNLPENDEDNDLFADASLSTSHPSSCPCVYFPSPALSAQVKVAPFVSSSFCLFAFSDLKTDDKVLHRGGESEISALNLQVAKNWRLPYPHLFPLRQNNRFSSLLWFFHFWVSKCDHTPVVWVACFQARKKRYHALWRRRLQNCSKFSTIASPIFKRCVSPFQAQFLREVTPIRSGKRGHAPGDVGELRKDFGEPPIFISVNNQSEKIQSELSDYDLVLC